MKKSVHLSAGLLACTLLGLLPQVATATVEVRRFEIGAVEAAEWAERGARPSAGGPSVAAPRFDQRWFTWYVPHFKVDTSNPGRETTLWAARNEEETVETLTVTYYDVDRNLPPQRIDTYMLQPNETRTVNLRDVPGLAVDPDGFARGFILLSNPSGFLSVDYIVVNPEEDFAHGSGAFETSFTRCSWWRVRFGTSGPLGFSTAVTFLLSPGTQLPPVGPGDPPTIEGTVYREDGTPHNTFEIRTTTYSFQLDADQLVSPGLEVGSITILFRTISGWATSEIRADGRYTIGSKGVCLDN